MGMPGVSVLLDAAEFPSDPVVVVVGISLVFLILLLLTFIITLQGKFFDRLTKSKAAKQAAAAPAAAPAAPPKPAACPAPVVEEGVPPEVVAVIAAAVASMDGGKYTLRSLTRAKDGRGAWGLAGVRHDTDPF